MRDIGEALKIPSTSVVNYNLNKLVKEGFITRDKKVSRGISLNFGIKPGDPHNSFQVPLLGQIVAGQPTPSFSNAFADEEIIVPQTMIGNVDPSEVYALRVNGLSMIDAMINDGDMVILRRQSTARNGEMVAAWLSDREETTLKKYYDEGGRIRLQPANPLMQPIFVEKDKVQIQGKVLGVLRTVS